MGGLFAPAGLSLILMPLQHIFLAVPTLNRKAEARPADLNVRPATDSLSGEESEDARAIGNALPTAISLFADEAVARAGISVARGAAFGEDDFGEAVAIEVAHFLDRARCVGGSTIVAGAPLLTLERVACSLERFAGAPSAEAQNRISGTLASKVVRFTGDLPVCIEWVRRSLLARLVRCVLPTKII